MTTPNNTVAGLPAKWREEVERGTGHLNDEADRAMLSLADELEDALASPTPSAPDAVREALQRLIENAATLGPSSREDALLVAKYRDSAERGAFYVFPTCKGPGVVTKETHDALSGVSAPVGVDGARAPTKAGWHWHFDGDVTRMLYVFPRLGHSYLAVLDEPNEVTGKRQFRMAEKMGGLWYGPLVPPAPAALTPPAAAPRVDGWKREFAAGFKSSFTYPAASEDGLNRSDSIFSDWNACCYRDQCRENARRLAASGQGILVSRELLIDIEEQLVDLSNEKSSNHGIYREREKLHDADVLQQVRLLLAAPTQENPHG